MNPDRLEKLTFLKLGGSLLTDKTAVEALRVDVLHRLASEIRQAIEMDTGLSLVLGHGSGSFGHVAAARFDTRNGVRSGSEWMAYAHVSDSAARLNRAVCEALLGAGIPVVSLQPSASAMCEDGRIVSLASETVKGALTVGIVPVVYGDVALDSVRGGTIISTEEIMSYLATKLSPTRILFAGETDGVLDERGDVIPEITGQSLATVSNSLSGSRGTDVTGGMVSKVLGMLDLVARVDGLSVRIFSGLEPGNVRDVLLGAGWQPGTLIV